MDTTSSNVIPQNFGGRPYQQIAELVDDLNAVLEKYAGQIPLAAAIGALRIVEHGLLQQEGE